MEYSKKVLIVESRHIGGTCVNVGCVPKKIMFNLATFFDDLKIMSGYSLSIPNHNFNFLEFKKRRDEYI